MRQTENGSGIKLVVYKRIVGGDLSKFTATSNIAQSGGGARDLRFSPADKFFPAFRRMFAEDADGILRGHFVWEDHDPTEVEIHPPTSSRPNEVRIGRVHECFPQAVVPSDAADCVLLIVLDDSGLVRPYFTSFRSLQNDNWHPMISGPIIEGVRAKRGAKTTAMGYIDMENGENYTQQMNAYEVLKNLQAKSNVLLMGAPGTGKSKLMNDAARIFESGAAVLPSPSLYPDQAIPIPAVQEDHTTGELPMMRRRHRKVFRTTLHQNSKYRDFLTGITPRFDGSEGYRISEGILYRANEYAKQPDSAALLIIDELNRGPAIEVFGGSIVAIEADKRLSEDNTAGRNTQFFEILSPETGEYVEYAFSPHLYILAAMNQADVSVAPLDVAFMRRWMCMPLEPDYGPVYERFKIQRDRSIPPEDPTVQDVYHAAVKALEAINKKITIGRGAEYRLGQGVFLSTAPQGGTLEEALNFAVDVWAMIDAHIEELFFGDPVAIAYILNADRDISPYSLQEVSFAGETKFILSHGEINPGTIYGLYRSLLEEEDL